MNALLHLQMSKVLVVAQDDFINRSMRLFLLQHGARMFKVSPTVKAARQALTREHFDIVVLEREMLGEEETVLLDELTDRSEPCAVILIADSGDAKQSGADSMIIKPITIEKMERAFQEILVEQDDE